MSVRHLTLDGGATVTICGPTMTEGSRTDEGIRWCFACRGRHPHTWVVMVPTEDEGWYWGPSAHMECGGCGAINRDLFPGWSRDWDDQ